MLLVLVFPVSPLPSLSSSLLKLIHTLRSLLLSVFRMFKIHLLEQFLLETFGQRFDMHIVAVPSSLAGAVNVLLALSIQEIRYRGEDSTDLLTLEKSAIDIVECIFRILLVAVLHIDVAHDVISQIVDDNHILDLAVLTHLFEYFLKK